MKGLGIVLFIAAIVVGMTIMALILGFWRHADIKKGKLKVESGLAPRKLKSLKAATK